MRPEEVATNIASRLDGDFDDGLNAFVDAYSEGPYVYVTIRDAAKEGAEEEFHLEVKVLN